MTEAGVWNGESSSQREWDNARRKTRPAAPATKVLIVLVEMSRGEKYPLNSDRFHSW